MANLEGPFLQTKFLGASVMNFSSTVGWNEQSSYLTVGVVEDDTAGDAFAPPSVGEPVTFAFDGFTFSGLLQKYDRTDDFNGSPVYSVQVTDPREILDGAQIIIASYRGSTSLIPNLINAFGYWEDKFGFGGSLVNDSGMLWSSTFDLTQASTQGINIKSLGMIGIKPAIETLTKKGNTYGGPLKFRGHSYSVDLSGLPTAPTYYRLGGVSRSIMNFVSELCSDAGGDYIVYLDGTTIKFKYVSRTKQPIIGVIANWVNSQTNVRAKSTGVELRNEPTNAVLLGGDVQELVQVYNPSGDNTIWPYWGFDVNGVPIVGVGQPEVDHQVMLNCSEISDIIGDVQYHCSVPELRCAMAEENAFDSWAAYVIRWESDKADTIGLVSAIDSTNDLSSIFPDVMFQRDMIAQRDHEAYFFGRVNESDYWTERAQRVFEFVRRYATEYFGRRFWVKIPFYINWTFVPETTLLISSEEISDGGYVNEGGMPLGLGYLDIDKFMSSDGRFECFVSFPYTQQMDLQKLSPDNCTLSNGNLYIKATIDQDVGIQYPGSSLLPYVCVVLAESVYELAPDPLGGVSDLAQLLNVPEANLVWAAGLRHGSFPMRIHPPPYRPQAAAIPMRSNRSSYGPWGTFPPWGTLGMPGKVIFDRQEELTPWEYGDWDTMNQAGQAKMAGATTNMQEGEIASLEQVGSPSISLGDALVAGGPNVTGIRCSVGNQGVVTTYDMQTFTPVFGAFQQKNAERLKRLGIAAQQMRRNMRTLFQRQLQRNQIISTALGGRAANMSRAVAQMSPHDCIYSTMTYDSQWGMRTEVSTATLPEMFANIRPDSSDVYMATGACSLEALFRPFTTDFTRDYGMPHYANVTNSAPITLEDLDPFGPPNDIDILLWGDKFAGIHTIKSHATGSDPDYTNARLMGLRGPIVVVGWGYDILGYPFPNKNDPYLTGPPLSGSDQFIDQHRLHPEKWKAGPIDLRWDRWRGVWSFPSILCVTLQQNFSAGGTLAGVSGTSDNITIYSFLPGVTNLTSGQRAIVGYSALDNKWYIIAAQCGS